MFCESIPPFGDITEILCSEWLTTGWLSDCAHQRRIEYIVWPPVMHRCPMFAKSEDRLLNILQDYLDIHIRCHHPALIRATLRL